jgi:hypothetical protein
VRIIEAAIPVFAEIQARVRGPVNPEQDSNSPDRQRPRGDIRRRRQQPAGSVRCHA